MKVEGLLYSNSSGLAAWCEKFGTTSVCVCGVCVPRVGFGDMMSLASHRWLVGDLIDPHATTEYRRR